MNNKIVENKALSPVEQLSVGCPAAVLGPALPEAIRVSASVQASPATPFEKRNNSLGCQTSYYL
jgi:hypothetical protein